MITQPQLIELTDSTLTALIAFTWISIDTGLTSVGVNAQPLKWLLAVFLVIGSVLIFWFYTQGGSVYLASGK